MSTPEQTTRTDGDVVVLHCTGSAVSDHWADLSRLYARQALAVLPMGDVLGRTYRHRVIDVSADDSWRFLDSLDREDWESAEVLDRPTALAHLASLDIDVAVPQMFCPPGLTDHRGLLALLGIPSVGNSATTMAATANKTWARGIVAAAGVDVPSATVVRKGDTPPDVVLPVVVKPTNADNSVGVSLVRHRDELSAAVASALEHGTEALVESFVPLGREVRCGTIRRRNGDVVALPLEEYAVDANEKPIRTAADKLARDDADELRLMAKTADQAWIVPDDDPIVGDVHEMAVRAHHALGCAHHGLIDVRIDPDGRPWFIEAGPYCSFAPTSVVVTMADAAGIGLDELFDEAVEQATDREASR